MEYSGGISYDGKSIGSDEGKPPSYDRLGALGVFFGDELGKFIGEEAVRTRLVSECDENY